MFYRGNQRTTRREEHFICLDNQELPHKSTFLGVLDDIAKDISNKIAMLSKWSYSLRILDVCHNCLRSKNDEKAQKFVGATFPIHPNSNNWWVTLSLTIPMLKPKIYMSFLFASTHTHLGIPLSLITCFQPHFFGSNDDDNTHYTM